SRDPNGLDSFEVAFRELTPMRAKIAERTGTLLALGRCAAGGSSWVSLATASDLATGLVLVCGPLLLIFPLRMMVRFLLRKRTSIHMSNEEIVLSSFMRQRRFDRNVDHAFALYPNDSEKEETERI